LELKLLPLVRNRFLSSTKSCTLLQLSQKSLGPVSHTYSPSPIMSSTQRNPPVPQVIYLTVAESSSQDQRRINRWDDSLASAELSAGRLPRRPLRRPRCHPSQEVTSSCHDEVHHQSPRWSDPASTKSSYLPRSPSRSSSSTSRGDVLGAMRQAAVCRTMIPCPPPPMGRFSERIPSRGPSRGSMPVVPHRFSTTMIH